MEKYTTSYKINSFFVTLNSLLLLMYTNHLAGIIQVTKTTINQEEGTFTSKGLFNCFVCTFLYIKPESDLQFVCLCTRWTNDDTSCLTCSFRSDCKYNSAYFSHNASYYHLSCSGQLYLLQLLQINCFCIIYMFL